MRLDSWTIHGGLNLHDAISYGLTNLPPSPTRARSDATDSGGDGVELVRSTAAPRLTRTARSSAMNGAKAAPSSGLIAVALSVWLSVGTHTLTLQVTDDDGATGTGQRGRDRHAPPICRRPRTQGRTRP